MPQEHPIELMVKPKHRLGSKYKTAELQSNRNMGIGAAGDAAVHPLQPGVVGTGLGRRGRKGRTR